MPLLPLAESARAGERGEAAADDGCFASRRGERDAAGCEASTNPFSEFNVSSACADSGALEAEASARCKSRSNAASHVRTRWICALADANALETGTASAWGDGDTAAGGAAIAPTRGDEDADAAAESEKGVWMLLPKPRAA